MKNVHSLSHHFRPRVNSFNAPSVNPLLHEIEWSLSRRIQCVLMAIFIVPIRLFLFCITTFFCWLISCFIIFLNKKFPQKPLIKSRKRLLNLLRIAVRLMYFVAGMYYIEVKGKRATASEAPILIGAPHTGYWDFVINLVSDPLASCLSRAENRTVPIMGKICTALGTIFVSRSDRKSKQKTIQEICSRVTASAGELRQITIYPEGVGLNRKGLITFKPGAFIPGVPVQPVLIEYLNDWNTFSWTAIDRGPYEGFLCSLCQISVKLRFTFMPVYYPSAAEKKSPRLYASNVRALMADALNIPCTDHTYDDWRLMKEAKSLNMPIELGAVEFEKINQKLGLNIEFLMDQLKKFSLISHNGLISLKDFSNFLKVPVTSALLKMFYLYDRDDSGFIDFREYIIGWSLVSQPVATKEAIKEVFLFFKKDNNIVITEKELNEGLRALFDDDVDGKKIFQEIEKASSNGVTFEELSQFVHEKPEFAKLILMGKELMPNAFFSEENM